MRRWRRCRRRWGSGRCARRRRTSRATTRSTNLVADFLDSDPANFVEDGDHVAVPGHTFGTDRYLNVGIGGVELEQPGQDLVILNILSIETDRIARADAN